MSGEGPLYEFSRTMWEMREERELSLCEVCCNLELTRLLYRAITSEMEHDARYNPEIDHRVRWAREVLAAARSRNGRPKADADVEGVMMYLLKVGDFSESAESETQTV